MVQRYDEYGNLDASTTMARYGWLGTATRAGDTPGGHILMGARAYDPATGTFLQDDPVTGGGDNAYGYCSGDPVNCTDTAGTFDYWLKYNVGNPHMSAKSYFKKFRDNFSWVFSIGGHASKRCRRQRRQKHRCRHHSQEVLHGHSDRHRGLGHQGSRPGHRARRPPLQLLLEARHL
ncbi:RHS repeat-associated core domain-containing protein [Streptomyces sp. NPDC059568]|uniref:RHS repeat-associated core domain-containing protein n=1 Tax=Streptomyces sp. NPDC059568 TaxID=3346868 RepID=UPI00367A5D51